MKPLLENASGELVEILKKRGRVKIFSETQQVFSEGESAKFLPIVVSGKIKIVRFLEAGKEVIISVFGGGEMFAVPPVFDGEPYPSTAIAMEKTEILLLGRKDFLLLLRESSEFSFAVIAWMCEMLREKTAAIQILATASPEQKVGKILLRLSEKETSVPVKITLRRRDIAEMAGLTTETTIRAVRKLAEKNFIQIRHGKIIVNAPDELREHFVK